MRFGDKDEADDLAAENRTRQRKRLDFFDLIWIVIGTVITLGGWAIGGFSRASAGESLFAAYGAYMVSRILHDASDLHESYMALQYRTRLINQRLIEIESKLKGPNQGRS